LQCQPKDYKKVQHTFFTQFKKRKNILNHLIGYLAKQKSEEKYLTMSAR
jgi:hypothetical protein